MRSRLRSLVLLAALAPACWSGFSEIRIAGADAGAPGDRPADVVRPLDAPDATSADVPAVVDAVPEDRAAVDVLAPLDAPAPDVADAAADVPGAIDAGDLRDVQVPDVAAPEDRVAGDVVDAPVAPDAGPCGGACGAGEVCVGGRCQASTRFVGAIFFADPTIYDAPPGATASWEMQCAARFAGSRLCRRADIEGTSLLAQVCSAVLPPRFDRSYGLAGLGDAPDPSGVTRPYYICTECPTNGFPGRVAGCHIPYAIACCAP